MRIGSGILAVWNDCAAGAEAGYEDWYLGEHLPERLSIPGFVWGRRYRRSGGASQQLPEYMTYYETQTPYVLTSDAYVERINNPTPETHRIMTTVFLNMNRTVCRRTAGQGAVRTSYCVVAVMQQKGMLSLNDLKADGPDTLWREAWENAEPSGQVVSREEKLRGGDQKISACLLIDRPSEVDAVSFAEHLATHAGVIASAYQLTGSLHALDLPTDR